MKKKCFYLGLLTCLAAVSSCSLESYEEPVEETYTKEFIKTFGLIDSNQDWNMVTRASVTVTTEDAAEIKVYGLTDGRYRLMGDFTDVQGTQLLQFDTPEGVTDLIVCDGSDAIKASVGQEITFGAKATRDIIINEGNKTSSNPKGVTVEKETNYYTFEESNKSNSTGIFEYANTLPENKVNLGKVDCNFYYVTGDKDYSFTLYPAYSCTSNYNDIVGIYYVQEGTYYYVPIYSLYNGGKLMEYSENGPTEQTTSVYRWMLYQAGIVEWKDLRTCTDEEKKSIVEYIKENYPNADGSDLNEQSISYSEDNVSFTQVTQTWATNYTPDMSSMNYVYWRSQGIKVTIPANTAFGFYLINNYNTYLYSQEDLNTGESKLPESGSYGSYGDYAGRYPCHVATFLNSKNMRCLCFEDWPYINGSLGDFDLNDLVFYTDLDISSNSGVTEINEDVQSYILAAEDLGNTDDYDFNDMVIKVSTPVSNSASTGDGDKWKVEVTALAAGGTLSLTLKWGDKVLQSPINDSEQFHSWFGDGSISTSTMINTTSNDKTGSTYTLYLSDQEKNAFTMSSCGNTDKMGGFTFVVTRSDGESSMIKAPYNGNAPQMICVPDTWKWPTERTNISTAYPEFGEWGANYTQNTWINTVNGPVIERE